MDATTDEFDHWPLRRLARVTIEFTTPFHVGTGRGGAGIDALVITDANHLPAIPGSSLAGALRAAVNPHLRDELFGFQRGNQGCGSRLSISWACIHNAANTPVEGVIDSARLAADPVLVNARTPRQRDHVKLHHQGAQQDRLKFDEWPVCAGHRFTFELELISQASPAEDAAWTTLLDTLRGGTIRLGGKTRRGFGAFKTRALRNDCYDLAKSDSADGFLAYRNRPARLAALPLKEDRDEKHPVSQAVTATLRLKPEGYWMVGSDDPDGISKKAPLRDDRVVWSGGKGSVERNALVLSGTALKGALVHRVAWHYNARKDGPRAAPTATLATDATAWQDARQALAEFAGEKNAAVTELFGLVKKDDKGRRGRVLVDDIFLQEGELRDQIVPHVAIDRFSGGALDGHLFTERPLWRSPTEIFFAVRVLEADTVSSASRGALAAALEDLTAGRLALGSGGGRGQGYFTGSISWSDPGWATGKPAPPEEPKP